MRLLDIAPTLLDLAGVDTPADDAGAVAAADDGDRAMTGPTLSLSRRAFLQTSAAVALAAVPVGGASAPYRVGVAKDSDPYAATQRAIAWSGEFPPVLGRTVVVKPNLMMPATADTGATTDPNVTRAVVDEALARGASMVIVTETSPHGAHFAVTGHDAFASYDSRVQLVDVGTLPIVLAAVPGGLAYPAILAPDLYLRQDIVFISVGKLKMHEQAFVSLSTKNLFGVPAVQRYVSFPSFGRFAMHDRGLQQAILDVNRLRSTHYAVIDGIWGMEGAGPAFGSPVRMNTVLAGRNTVAVDRVAMYLMNVPQYAVRYPDLRVAFRTRTCRSVGGVCGRRFRDAANVRGACRVARHRVSARHPLRDPAQCAARGDDRALVR